jgi:hypothetical protein
LGKLNTYFGKGPLLKIFCISDFGIVFKDWEIKIKYFNHSSLWVMNLISGNPQVVPSSSS